jgi:hypothetical protein
MNIEEETEEPEEGDEPVEDLNDHGSMTGNEPRHSKHWHATSQKRDNDGRNEAIRKIADASKEWAGQLLRREDMLVYVYCLPLEYAMVVDDRREGLGFVEDLLEIQEVLTPTIVLLRKGRHRHKSEAMETTIQLNATSPEHGSSGRVAYLTSTRTAIQTFPYTTPSDISILLLSTPPTHHINRYNTYTNPTTNTRLPTLSAQAA